MSQRSIHDNNVYAYSVLCEQRRIVLHTEYRDGGAEELTDVAFSGVVGHHFENALQGNILFGIDEVNPERIIQDWADLFARRKNFGWPDGIEYRDADDLATTLRQRGVKGFEIASSFGLSGWVLATEMAVSERTAKVEVDE